MPDAEAFEVAAGEVNRGKALALPGSRLRNCKREHRCASVAEGLGQQ